MVYIVEVAVCEQSLHQFRCNNKKSASSPLNALPCQNNNYSRYNAADLCKWTHTHTEIRPIFDILIGKLKQWIVERGEES